MEKKVDTIQLAIAGLGHIGRRHARIIMENASCKLVAVCDIDPNKEQELPAGIPFYHSLAAMLAGTPFDILCVCTPNYLHCEQAIAGLEAGRHILVEKPLALTAADCQRIIDTAGQRQRHIFPVMQNRFNPAIQWAKKLVDGGHLGNIFYIQVNCYWNRNEDYYAQSNWRGTRRQDGGILFTQFSHFVDAMYYLNGPVVASTGFISNYLHQANTELADTGSFTLRAANGSIVNLNFTTNAFRKNMEGSITIFGAKGTIKVGGQYLNKIDYCEVADYMLSEEEQLRINTCRKPNHYGTYQGSMSNHEEVYQNIINTLQRNAPFYTSPADGKAVVEIIENLYRNCTEI